LKHKTGKGSIHRKEWRRQTTGEIPFLAGFRRFILPIPELGTAFALVEPTHRSITLTTFFIL
jgi:hypothetical protein